MLDGNPDGVMPAKPDPAKSDPGSVIDGGRAADVSRTADVEPILRLVRFAEECEAGWRQWFASTGIQPCEVSYEDLAQDRLAVANRVLGFLDLPRLEPGHLPPVRYCQQADRLTEHYVDLVHAATEGRCGPR